MLILASGSYMLIHVCSESTSLDCQYQGRLNLGLEHGFVVNGNSLQMYFYILKIFVRDSLVHIFGIAPTFLLYIQFFL